MKMSTPITHGLELARQDCRLLVVGHKILMQKVTLG